MKKFLSITAIIGTGILSFSHTLIAQSKPTGDLVVQWNLITIKAEKAAKQNSNLGSRTAAIEAIAVYDAVNSIKHFGTPYHYNATVTGPASVQAAVAQAAHDVLVSFFPAQKPALDSALDNSLQGIKEYAIDNGRKAGAASAAEIIALRANDGSSPLTS